MKQRLYYLVAVFLMAFSVVIAQERNCGSNEYLEMQLKNNPGLQTKMAQLEELTQLRASQTQAQNNGVLYIPVVVHILYNSANPVENISDAQIISQMDVLYKDFRRLNEDADDTWEQAADMEIEYYLAQIDPDGNATNGITRTETNVEVWGVSNDMKSSASGGVDPWDATKYFNIWVANLGSNLLGFAQFPDGDPATDGVVMNTGVFGDASAEGSEDFYLTFPAYANGRTLSHEVGHFLNLRHIWGDGPCGFDDFVDDTPEQDSPTVGCPTSQSSCGTEDMFQNYMDYTDDACMNLFTLGQKNRMRAVLEEGGPRETLVQPPFPYFLDVAEGVSNICTPEDASFDFSLSLKDPEFSETVSFSVSGLPEGASATFSPNQASEDATTVNLTITGLANATVGRYDLTVEGTAGDDVVPASLILNVYSDQFEDVVLETPADGASDVVVSELEWSADPNAVAYEVELASDSNFNNILESGTVSVPEYSPLSIQSLSTYYWRVRAVNDCGTSDYTQASFSTADVVCSDFSSDTAVAIPDGSPTGAKSIIEVNSLYLVSDVNVTVNITHTWVEDLTISLIAPDGTEVILSQKNGGNGDNYINTVFDSDSDTPIGTIAPPFTGTFAPDGDLSDFVGVISAGEWELKVVDDTFFDAGSIESWSIEICGAPQPDADGDLVMDDLDNCPDIANNDQSDIDEDGLGDVCDDDIDGDGIPNEDDNCPETANPDQSDEDGDGIGDLCDILCNVAESGAIGLPIPDASATGVDASLTFPGALEITDVNVTVNITHTFTGDLTLILTGPSGTNVILSAENGGGGDNFVNTVFDDEAEDLISESGAPFTGSFVPEEPLSTFTGENSGGVWTLNVADNAGFDTGTIDSWSLDICGFEQDDADGDGVPDGVDNCPDTANNDQADTDEDGIGDVCDDDIDGDGLLNTEDNCPQVANPGQEDIDGDGIGDVCDVECGVYVSEDVPIEIAADAGDVEAYEATVEVTENIYITDINVTVNMDHTWNEDLALFLVNPQGEFIELSIFNGGNSQNYTDTVFDDDAETPITAGTGPFTGSFSPEEPLSTFNGQLSQGTWILGVVDVFPPLDGGVINSFTLELCGTRDPFDYDLDTVLNDDDNCVFAENTDQTDTDGDGQGDVCDDDDDNDGLLDEEDNCPLIANADQADNDGDGIGDVCDDDDDNDGVLDEDDNCQFEPNPDQLDADGDGIGNACDDMLPNDVLTPNGDGINDTWIIIASSRFPNANIKVFNRWGKEVYSYSGEYNNDWDGSSDSGSSTLPTGSYFYQIDQNGDGSVIVTGWVYIAK